MIYVGGLRARLVRDSVYRTIEAGLRDLGWLTPQDTRHDVQLLPEPVPTDKDVPLNSVALSDELTSSTPAELGSLLSELSWSMFFDVYAENDSVSLHLAGDIAALLAGRMASVGRTRPVVTVWDWALATPVELFEVEIEDVQTEKAHDFPQPWLRFWRSVSFRVVDSYAGELG